jgi:nucleotide-binding universal stress UspA family protein
MPRIRTILHPTDFSDTATRAFKYACEMARDNRARLVAMHVLEPVGPLMADGIMLPMETEYVRGAAREQLRTLAPTERGFEFERMFREGLAPDAIVEAADEVRADLIVMGTHGRSGLSRLLLGSVAEQVLRRARCPVLFVKETQPTPAEGTGPRSRTATTAVESWARI